MWNTNIWLSSKMSQHYRGILLCLLWGFPSQWFQQVHQRYMLSLSVSLSHDFVKCKHYIYICSLRIWIPGNSARQYFTNKQDKNAAISFLIVDEVSSQCLGVADTCQYGCRVEGPRAFCYCPLGYTLNPDQTTCTCMSLYNQYLIITLVQGQAILICYQCNLLYPVV